MVGSLAGCRKCVRPAQALIDCCTIEEQPGCMMYIAISMQHTSTSGVEGFSFVTVQWYSSIVALYVQSFFFHFQTLYFSRESALSAQRMRRAKLCVSIRWLFAFFGKYFEVG